MRLFGIIAFLAVAACAQQMVSLQTSGDTAIITLRVKETTFTTFSGAPYSAKRVTVATEIRADGTRVPQNRTALFYRDSAGRNRTEQQAVLRESPVIATIMDPILGCEYVLDPGNKIAHRLVGVQIGTMPVPQADSGRPEPEDLAPAAAAPSSIAVHTEDLGTRTMQGLAVHGTKTTTTWPPGTRQGNDRTVVSEYESWIAPSLGRLVVSSRTVEPGTPESTYELENVVVGEPDAHLFSPPPDYRIVDEKSDFKISVPRSPTSTVTKLAAHGPTAATIPNAPFSGTRVATGTQILADGTRVGRPEQTTFSAWRDSQGRVRTEWPPRGIVPGGVEIKDPTTGFTWNLDYVNHIAYRTRLAPDAAGVPAAAVSKPGDAAAETVTVTQLGTDIVSGVPATGARTTTAPLTGTAKPKVVEIWTARTEGVMLLEKETSAGDETTVTLKNFSTREPDPSLFRVPATYQVFDEAGNQIQTKQQ